MNKKLILRMLSTVAFGMLMTSSYQICQAQTFTDATFNGTDWTATKIIDTTAGALATFSVTSPDLLNGLPLSSRTTKHTYGIGQIIVAHLRAGAFYDPASQGAIGSINYSYDLNHYTPPAAQAVAYAVLILQGTTYYRGPIDAIFNNAWQHFGTSLNAAAFVRIFGDGPLQPDFSCTGSRIQFGYVSGNSNPSTVATQTRTSGIDNWTVKIIEPRPCCGVIVDETVLCDKSGSFTYTFNVTNTSNQIVQYLFFSPPSGATYTFSPSVINLGSNPLSNGQSTSVTITVSNAAPGQNICININLADKSVQSCCTLKHCFDLPTCDCLQIVRATITCVPNQAGSYTYTFTVENLTTVGISQLFVVPVSPASLTISPQLFTFSTPLPPHQTTTQTITITGANAGTNICLKFVPRTENGSICCSIEKCFTLPSCIPK